MDFELGEEESLLRDTVRGLCDQRVRPEAGAWDEVRALPDGLLSELGEMGLLAMEIAEDAGGAGLSAVAATALCEELASADGALAQVIAAHNHLGLAHVAAKASEAMRESELPALVGGEHVVAWALPEHARAGGESDLGIVARRDGDDWILEGRVPHVLGASLAGRVVVFADTNAGPGAWMFDVGTDGVGIEPTRTLGARAAGIGHVALQAVRVPDGQRLGEPGAALVDARGLLVRHDIACAAVACGLARGALQVSAAYAQEREQFGRPIARFQAIQWKLADMGTTLDAAWLLTMKAAWRRDAGRPEDEVARAAARARAYAGPMATRACSEALQIHGGYGYTREYPVERALRDARQHEGRGGSAMRLRLADAIAQRFAG